MDMITVIAWLGLALISLLMGVYMSPGARKYKVPVLLLAGSGWLGWWIAAYATTCLSKGVFDYEGILAEKISLVAFGFAVTIGAIGYFWGMCFVSWMSQEEENPAPR